MPHTANADHGGDIVHLKLITELLDIVVTQRTSSVNAKPTKQPGAFVVFVRTAKEGATIPGSDGLDSLKLETGKIRVCTDQPSFMSLILPILKSVS